MAEKKQTLYEVLGVPRDAKLTDITRAYNRHKSSVTRDDAAPDLKRETTIREAYETLSDEARREAYDQSLVEPDRRHRSRLRGIGIGVAGVALAGGYLVFLRPAPAPVAVVRTAEQILADASFSIGRLKAIDMSGRATNPGLALVIGENIVVSTCHGVTPTSQVIVDIAQREVPARVFDVDEETGLCRLIAKGVGSRPLEAAQAEAKAGDIVYAAKVDAAGKVALAQGTVKRVVFEPKAKVIESAASGPGGAPLLDARGQLLAVSTGAEGRHISIPAAWIAEAREPFREERYVPPQPPAPDPPQLPAGTSPQDAKALQYISPEQRQKLEKAYRPPPDSKDDWMK
jgi:hypothetical protein